MFVLNPALVPMRGGWSQQNAAPRAMQQGEQVQGAGSPNLGSLSATQDNSTEQWSQLRAGSLVTAELPWYVISADNETQN